MEVILGTMTFGESVFGESVSDFINCFDTRNYREIDTAFVYNDGLSEKLIGNCLAQREHQFDISTKVNPRVTGRLDYSAVELQVTKSMERLKTETIKTIYLHFPDASTPVESALEAVNDFWMQGKIKELGLSNYPTREVLNIWNVCEKKGWIKPTVYQGMYNSLARKAENDLFPCLRSCGIRFYAYNPLAGGILSGRYKNEDEKIDAGRFVNRPNYISRYWKKSFFAALKIIRTECESENLPMAEASLRWLAYHSLLDSTSLDGIIVGASKLEHLQQNLDAICKGPLPERLVEAYNKAWEIVQDDSPEYYRYYVKEKK